MALRDQVLGQRLVINAGGLQSKDDSFETIPLHVKTHLSQQMGKSLSAVLNDQPFEHRLAIGTSQKRMVLAFPNIQTNNQNLGRTPNLLLELTEFINFATLIFVHGNLLLDLRVMGLGYPYANRRLLFYLRDNIFLFCYTSKDLLSLLKYITLFSL